VFEATELELLEATLEELLDLLDELLDLLEELLEVTLEELLDLLDELLEGLLDFELLELAVPVGAEHSLTPPAMRLPNVAELHTNEPVSTL
jgi:hypothetical protein